MEVEHDLANALVDQMAQGVRDERPFVERDGRLGDEARQRIEARAETRREDERGDHERDAVT